VAVHEVQTRLKPHLDGETAIKCGRNFAKAFAHSRIQRSRMTVLNAHSHVLIAEDDPSIGRALVILVQSVGRKSKLVANGREALDSLCEPPHPCLVLLDLGMPVMDGEEFLQLKNRNPSVSRIPVVVVTAFDLRGRVLSGVSTVVRKPFEPSSLMELVQRHC
jgi:CheY-like chemotaxis protein